LLLIEVFIKVYITVCELINITVRNKYELLCQLAQHMLSQMELL